MVRLRSLAFPLALGSGLALVCNTGLGAQAPATTQTSGCTLSHRVYTCNWDSFRTAFAAANTVAVETEPMDHFTRHQLQQLVQTHGKTVANPDQPADLVLSLTPVNNGGIEIGPSDKALASLRIYAPGSGGARGALLWAETYTAQPDRPWPATVHALLQQFQAHFTGTAAR